MFALDYKNYNARSSFFYHGDYAHMFEGDRNRQLQPHRVGEICEKCALAVLDCCDCFCAIERKQCFCRLLPFVCTFNFVAAN